MAAERRTRNWWAATVARWKRSGLSAREFAAREGVSERTLTWWSSMLRRGTRALRGSAKTTAIAPIEIEVPRAASASADTLLVEIAVGEVVVRVAVGADVEYVRSLVTALGARG